VSEIMWAESLSRHGLFYVFSADIYELNPAESRAVILVSHYADRCI